MIEDTGTMSRPVPACIRSRPGPARKSAESVLHATRNCCLTFTGPIRDQRVALRPRLHVAVTRSFEVRFSRDLVIPKALDELYARSVVARRGTRPGIDPRASNTGLGEAGDPVCCTVLVSVAPSSAPRKLSGLGRSLPSTPWARISYGTARDRPFAATRGMFQ